MFKFTNMKKKHAFLPALGANLEFFNDEIHGKGSV